MIDVEEWKVIDEFPIYSVSNKGNVRNDKRKCTLLGGHDRDGYRQVTLSYKGKQYNRRICRLVAIAFIPNPNNLPQVNHKDENKEHDYVDNLEWCTSEYNNNYGMRTQLTRKRVRCIETGKIYDGVRVASREFNIPHQNIGKACKTGCAAGGYHWKYITGENIMTREEKQKIFEPLSRNFETEQFKMYFMDMIAEIPEYIFTMPSSTSGKYHNATQCQTYGQVYHAYMFDSILNHRLRLKWNKELYSTPEERDCMRCIPTFHDAVKCGWNGSKYTVQDHPVLASKWILETKVEHDIPVEYKQMIADMCESHSGEWNKNRSGQVIMAEPRNHREFFIHECDILASRVDLDYIIPDELKTLLEGNAKIELPSIEEYIFPFGKHKGKTLLEVKSCDPGYISWAKKNLEKDEVLKALLSQM